MASIHKRTGKWQVQIRRAGNAPFSRTFHLNSDTQEWAREMERRADRKGLQIDSKALDRVTLGQLVERYRDTVLPQKSAVIGIFILSTFLRKPICGKVAHE